MYDAYKVGMAFFYAGKSPNDLLAFCGGDKRDVRFRRALGMYDQLKKRSDGEPEQDIDAKLARVRADSDAKNYVIDKIADNLAELKRKADRVFGRLGDITDSEPAEDCALENPGEVP